MVRRVRSSDHRGSWGGPSTRGRSDIRDCEGWKTSSPRSICPLGPRRSTSNDRLGRRRCSPVPSALFDERTPRQADARSGVVYLSDAVKPLSLNATIHVQQRAARKANGDLDTRIALAAKGEDALETKGHNRYPRTRLQTLFVMERRSVTPRR